MPGKNKPTAKKHKFVKDGIFYAELNTLLAKELAEDGYGGCEVRVTPTRTEVVILATKTTNVVGQNARRIKELTALVQKRFKFEKGQIMLFAEMVRNKGLSALSQAEAVRFRLFEGLSVRRAAYSVLKFIMDRGAKGVEVTVSGKLRGQRAKSMKFRDGYMIHAGDAVNYYIDYAVKHVHLRQGVIGIKVKIMLPHDPTGVAGPKKDLPDVITIHPPKELGGDTNTGAGGGGVSGGLQHDVRNRYAPNISPPQDTGIDGAPIDHHRQQQQQQQQQQHNQYEQQGGGQSRRFNQHNQNENTQFQQQHDQQQHVDHNQYGQQQQQQQQQNFNQYNRNSRQDQGNFNQHGGRGQQQQGHNQNQQQGYYNQGGNQNRGGFNH